MLKNGIDPKWTVLLGFLIYLEKGIGQGAVSLTNMIPASWIPHVLAWSNGLAWGGVGLMTFLAALSSSATGPLVSAPNLPGLSIDATKTIAKVLIAAFVLSMFLAGNPAQAAERASSARNLVTVSGKQLTRVTITKQKAIDNPFSVFQTFTEGDLQAALADAQANSDTAAVDCYSALLPIVQTGIGNPLPAGLGGFQLLQKARDLKALAGSINAPNGPLAKLNIACAPLVIDAQNTAIQLGIIGGGVIATSGVALPGLAGIIAALGL